MTNMKFLFCLRPCALSFSAENEARAVADKEEMSTMDEVDRAAFMKMCKKEYHTKFVAKRKKEGYQPPVAKLANGEAEVRSSDLR